MIREFNSYREILAIDPGLQATGWAVLSDKTGTLLSCGMVRPFAQVSQTHSIAELRSKIMKIWEERVGFSKNPVALAVELPQIYQQKFLKGDPNDLIPLSVMSGLFWASFNPGKCFLPRPATWKGQVPKDVMQERIISKLSTSSKRILAESLQTVPKYLRHNVYDAVGIGLWAFKQLQGEVK
ncbi:MAG: hypothetical protein WCK42_08650 [Myxococcaceae bacterium]